MSCKGFAGDEGDDDLPMLAEPFVFWAASLTDLDLSNNFISEYGDFSCAHLEELSPACLQN